MNLNPTKRFSNRVENYIKYRPNYPPAIIDFLHTTCQLTPTSVIADLGSGTGLLSELFLAYGCPVFGVEPNPDMRLASEDFLKPYPNFTSLAAQAETTTLPANSVEFITAGQSFHWFDPQPAYLEFKRILKPHGWIVLIWNERQTHTPLLIAYEQLLNHYAPEYETVYHRHIDDNALTDLLGPKLKRTSFDNHQLFDFAALKGRLLSSSYTPLAGQANYKAMISALEEIFQANQEHGQIRFEYATQVYYCQV